jgi:hypothetical protein
MKSGQQFFSVDFSPGEFGIEGGVGSGRQLRSFERQAQQLVIRLALVFFC